MNGRPKCGVPEKQKVCFANLFFHCCICGQDCGSQSDGMTTAPLPPPPLPQSLQPINYALPLSPSSADK